MKLFELIVIERCFFFFIVFVCVWECIIGRVWEVYHYIKMSRFYPLLFRSGDIKLMSIHNSFFDVIPCQPKYSFELSQLLWIESLWFTSLCKPVLLFYVNLDLFSLWILCQYRHSYLLTSGYSKLTLKILSQLVWDESLWLFSVCWLVLCFMST